METSRRSRWRKRDTARSGSLLLALLLMITACSGGEEPAATTSENEPTATTSTGGTTGDTSETPTDEPVEITVWFARDYVPADDFAQLEAEHNIRVTWDIRPDDNMLPTMLEMREAGEPLPDLIEEEGYTTPNYIAADLYQPMTEFVDRFAEEDPDLFETILPAVWNDGTFDEEIWFAAWQTSYDLIYYNVGLVESAGVEVPWTPESWGEVQEVAMAIRDANPDLVSTFAVGARSANPYNYWLTTFGAPYDGPVPDLTSPQGLDVLEFMLTMNSEGIMDPGQVVGDQAADQAKGAFITGDTAMIMDGVNAGLDWLAAEGFDYGDDWLSTPMPIHEADGGQHMSIPRGWGITSGSEHPYEASLALRYLMDPEIAVERHLQGTSTPRSTAVLEDPRIVEAQPYFTDEAKEAFFSITAQVPPGTNTLEVAAILIDLRDEVLGTGTDATPEELAAKYQPLLDETKP